jgi:protein-S-isoprenylcysteine O-methyltransferase Ste14
MQLLELKVPPVLLVILSGFLMWQLAIQFPQFTVEFYGNWVAAGIVFLTGTAMVLAGVFAFNRAQTTVNPTAVESTSSLVVTGIYEITRNPMYVGFLLILLAFGILLSNFAALIPIPCFVVYMNYFQITPEERILSVKFGADFETYKNSVRRWL